MKSNMARGLVIVDVTESREIEKEEIETETETETRPGSRMENRKSQIKEGIVHGALEPGMLLAVILRNIFTCEVFMHRDFVHNQCVE